MANAGIDPGIIDTALYGYYNPLYRGQIMGDIYVNSMLRPQDERTGQVSDYWFVPD